jgi:hypothetical protein
MRTQRGGFHPALAARDRTQRLGLLHEMLGFPLPEILEGSSRPTLSQCSLDPRHPFDLRCQARGGPRLARRAVTLTSRVRGWG